MSETKHNPAPWGYWPECCRLGGMITSAGGGHVCEPTYYDSAQERTKANAEHIVRCVNSHDALVAACKKIENWWRLPSAMRTIPAIEDAVSSALEALRDAGIGESEV